MMPFKRVKKQLEMALKPHYLSEVSEEKIQAVLNELNLSSLNELFMEIGVGNQMSSVIAHQLMDEAIEINVDGVSENTQSTLTLSRDGENGKRLSLNVVIQFRVIRSWH